MDKTAENFIKLYYSEIRDDLECECDVCGKHIVGTKNFIDVGDKTVCSEKCKQQAIADFHWWSQRKNKRLYL